MNNAALKLAVLAALLVVAAVAPAGAASTQSVARQATGATGASGATGPSDYVTLSAVPKSIASGAILSFNLDSYYSETAAIRMLVFATPAPAAGCPTTASAPKGADVILNDSVDAYLLMGGLSDPLRPSGHWDLCAYLTDRATVLASASTPFVVKPAKPAKKVKPTKTVKRKRK